MVKDSLTAVIQVLRREKVFLLLSLVACLVLIGGVGYWASESSKDAWFHHLGNGIWWAFVTITTTGYGDIVPQTVGGKLVAIILMMGGLFTISVLTATVASIFVERKFRRERGLEAVTALNHLLILGWNFDAEAFLDHVLRRLPAEMAIVLVNKLPQEQLEALKEKYSQRQLHYVRGDYHREEVLQKADVPHAAKGIILADRQPGESAAQVDQRTLLTALTLKSLNPKIRLLAENLENESLAYLERAGVEQVLRRGEFFSAVLAEAVASPGLYRVHSSLVTGDLQNLWTIEVPGLFQDRTIKEFSAYLKEHHQALVIAIYTEARGLDLEDLLGDETSAIDNFIRRKFAETGMTHLFGRSKVDFQINPPDNLILGPRQYVVIIAPQRPKL